MATSAQFTQNIISHDGQLIQNTICNSLVRYYKGLQLAEKLAPSQENFEKVNTNISLEWPDLNEEYIHFFQPANMSKQRLQDYKNNPIQLLNLMSDPNTNTTKTFGTLLTVAKLVHYIRKNNQKVIVLAPSSGNKAFAFRSAIERAITTGLVSKEELRVVSIIPNQSKYKFRSSTLYKDKTLRKLNPTFVYSGSKTENVKAIAREFYKENFHFLDKKGILLWYSLDIDNYRIADAARAFFDYELSLEKPKINSFGNNVWHAHSVSSAYGLIGYSLGCEVLVEQGILPRNNLPGYLLVQHLATPDMVLHLHFNCFDFKHLPNYQYDSNEHYYYQNKSPYFPSYTDDITEVLEPTFYSHQPRTSELMSRLIRSQGGSGIVVSLAECINSYPRIRQVLKEANIELPLDLRTIKEWSLIMAFTGVFNAIDRGLLEDGKEIVIHGSGFYSDLNIGDNSTRSLIDINESNAMKKLSKEIYKCI